MIGPDALLFACPAGSDERYTGKVAITRIAGLTFSAQEGKIIQYNFNMRRR